MSMKPLEPGCLALVIRDEEAGMVVTCVEYCPPGFKYRTQAGEVRQTLVPAWITLDPDGVSGLRPSVSLMRIDGGESVIEKREMEVMA